MHPKLYRMSCLILFSILTTSVFAQQEFSADVLNNSEKAPSTSARVYASKDKLRLEGFTRGTGHTGAMIINFAAQTTDILIPQAKKYIESPMGQGPGALPAFNFFRAADLENACDEWQRVANKPGRSCYKVGNEEVNGRSTVKYQGTSADGDISYVWLDTKLRFPVKWQGKNSGGELRNIQEEAQPAGLFTVPAGYQKMDMVGLGMPGSPPSH